jgi:ribosomal protein L37E
MSFVIRVRFVAECGFGRIERNRDALGLERFAGIKE